MKVSNTTHVKVYYSYFQKKKKTNPDRATEPTPSNEARGKPKGRTERADGDSRLFSIDVVVISSALPPSHPLSLPPADRPAPAVSRSSAVCFPSVPFRLNSLLPRLPVHDDDDGDDADRRYSPLTTSRPRARAGGGGRCRLSLSNASDVGQVGPVDVVTDSSISTSEWLPLADLLPAELTMPAAAPFVFRRSRGGDDHCRDRLNEMSSNVKGPR